MFSENPSIADLSLACEIGQLESIDFEGLNFKETYPQIYFWFYEVMMKIPEFKKE